MCCVVDEGLNLSWKICIASVEVEDTPPLLMIWRPQCPLSAGARGLTVRMLRSKELCCCCCMLMCVDNEEFDAEVSATTEPGTDDRTAIASEKMESGRPPARPQPPVCLMLMSCIVLAD